MASKLAIVVGAPPVATEDSLFHAFLCAGMADKAGGLDAVYWERVASRLIPGAFGMILAPEKDAHRMVIAIEDAGFVIHPTLFVWTSNGKPGTPALRSIILFQKIYQNKPVHDIVATGAGALHIEGALIPTDPDVDDMLREVSRGERLSKVWRDGSGFKNSANNLTGVRDEGRWPANFALVHTTECSVIGVNRWACPAQCPAHLLGSQSGILRSGTGAVKRASAKGSQHATYQAESRPAGTPNVQHGDSGTAARYFYQAGWEYERREEEKRGIATTGAGVPISLFEWLARILLPPPLYAPRRLLIPYGGSESAVIGALLAEWDEITAVEMSGNRDERARFAWWEAALKE